ncbi:type I deoxyribonuclease HsdR [Arenibacter certesii]|uniref:Type I deoxyribonuclease HsdR n=2 Tax=Arenibacter certesii TaxID=228955 RepID=A0A918MR42_9FLAO|nr:type I deoxyribonuclease HsdR [Arenibacter certesii]
MFFGVLISLECYGAILTGWVKRNLINPQFTFSFIGFEWLQPLPGAGMYYYFFLMGTLGVCIALGYKYRFSMLAFTVLWAGVYLMQKTAYNNHYYLLLLLSGMMFFLPANKNYAIDARLDPRIRENTMFAYVKWVIVLQLLIVYTYAAIAKMYGDWLDFSFLKILFQGKAHYPLVGDLLQYTTLHKFIGLSGILFDLLIVPALLWKPTRKWAFLASIFFHLFNSIVFQIGIFPYLALAFTIFFYPPELIRRIFLKNKSTFIEVDFQSPSNKKWIIGLITLYFSVQLVLPIRHYFIEDDVLWTEEGHRMSWRMMLRSRQGIATYKVVSKTTGDVYMVDLDSYMTKAQQRKAACYPDFIWQFAQHLKREYKANGEEVSVFVDSRVGVNGKPFRPFIDPNVDLANERWNYFWHNPWILPSKMKDFPLEK